MLSVLVEGICEKVKPLKKGDLMIDVKSNEIAIAPGYFDTARHQNKFVSVVSDPKQSIKLIGKSYDGKIYVSEKCEPDMTDEERAAYLEHYHLTEKEVDDFLNNRNNTHVLNFKKGTVIF